MRVFNHNLSAYVLVPFSSPHPMGMAETKDNISSHILIISSVIHYTLRV